MSLDFTECDQARLARDAAYDGRLYTGVHTTGIYCRPICPVRPARSANVSFFPSAAAAEAAGFRGAVNPADVRAIAAAASALIEAAAGKIAVGR